MSQSFEPQRVDYLSPENSGRIGSVTAGWPLWSMSVTLNNMVPHNADIWRAWVASQRGSQRLFLGRDLDRTRPRWHLERGFAAPVPTGWSQAIDDAGDCVLTLDTSSLLVLSLGDYVGFRWGTMQRSLVRVVDGAASSGGSVAVTVEPPVPSITSANASVVLEKPDCLMRLMTSSTQMAEQAIGYTVSGSKIVGIQELLP